MTSKDWKKSIKSKYWKTWSWKSSIFCLYYKIRQKTLLRSFLQKNQYSTVIRNALIISKLSMSKARVRWTLVGLVSLFRTRLKIYLNLLQIMGNKTLFVAITSIIWAVLINQRAFKPTLIKSNLSQYLKNNCSTKRLSHLSLRMKRISWNKLLERVKRT